MARGNSKQKKASKNTWKWGTREGEAETHRLSYLRLERRENAKNAAHFFTPFFPAETFQHFTSGGKRASNAELVAFMRKVSLSAFQKKTSQRGKELRRQQCHTNKSAERETAWTFQKNSSGTKPRKWTRYDFRTKRSSHPRASCSRNHSRGAGKFAGN